jgi:hypothetical protein
MEKLETTVANLQQQLATEISSHKVCDGPGTCSSQRDSSAAANEIARLQKAMEDGKRQLHESDEKWRGSPFALIFSLFSDFGLRDSEMDTEHSGTASGLTYRL